MKFSLLIDFDLTMFGIISDTDCKDRAKRNTIKAFLLLFLRFSSKKIGSLVKPCV